MPVQYKLIGNPFMASVDIDGNHPDKRNSVFVVNSFMVPKGYSAYILKSDFPEEYARNLASYFPNASILYGIGTDIEFNNYDVIDVNDTGSLRFLYSDTSCDSVLFITNKCNSNCIMCPDSDTNRRRDFGNRTVYLKKMIDLMPSDVRHLTITGGEPTLIKWNLIDILEKCRDKFEKTEFLMLSNGRTLSDKKYRDSFVNAIPERFRLGVPIYSDNREKHDLITRAMGSFDQTLSALTALQHLIEIEIRIVLMQDTYRQLPHIARFLTRKLPHIYTVSLMGIELLGNAAIKRNELWIDFDKTTPYIEEAVQILVSAGIDARIYNYPLCSLPRSLWSISAKSISDYKVRYQEGCEHCSVKSYCGGFFNSTMRAVQIPIHPIKESNSDDTK